MALKPAKPGAPFAWRWHYGLRMLKRAYNSSRTQADSEKASIEETAAKFDAKVKAGEAQWIEYDEDGYPGYDYGEHLGERLYEEETVLRLVRLAFIISLHHYVEHQIGERLPNKKYVQSDAMNWLKSFGWKPKEAELNELRLAANCAKHSGDGPAKQLFKLRPELFNAEKISQGFDPDYDSLEIADAYVEAFFKAVKQSVPSDLGLSL